MPGAKLNQSGGISSMSDAIDLSAPDTRVEKTKNAKTDNFEGLYKIEIEKYLKGKGDHDYLPWSMSWGLFLHYRPDAEYVFEPDRCFESGEVEVVVTVTSLGKSIQMIAPVTDFRNKPVINPNRFQVNTARMRCLTKAIAMHGLGLSCWNWVAINEIDDFGDQAAPPTPEATSIPEPQQGLPEQVYQDHLTKLVTGEATMEQANAYYKQHKMEPSNEQLANLVLAAAEGQQKPHVESAA